MLDASLDEHCLYPDLAATVPLAPSRSSSSDVDRLILQPVPDRAAGQGVGSRPVGIALVDVAAGLRRSPQLGPAIIPMIVRPFPEMRRGAAHAAAHARGGLLDAGEELNVVAGVVDHHLMTGDEGENK